MATPCCWAKTGKGLFWIGILKQNLLGRPIRAKGCEHRDVALAWGVLTHNGDNDLLS